MNPASKVEDPEAPMAGNQLAERQIYGFALRPHAGETLRFPHHLVIDLDIGPHTPQRTHCVVYAPSVGQAARFDDVLVALARERLDLSRGRAERLLATPKAQDDYVPCARRASPGRAAAPQAWRIRTAATRAPSTRLTISSKLSASKGSPGRRRHRRSWPARRLHAHAAVWRCAAPGSEGMDVRS